MIVAFFTGGPFVPTPGRLVEEIIASSKIKKGDTFVDLGAGDGRLLIAAAKRGARAIGWEINPLLVVWARLRIVLAGVSGKTAIYWNDYRRVDLTPATIVFLYGIPGHMKAIEQKLKKELRQGTRVISYRFSFPDSEVRKKTTSGLYYYIF